MCRLSMHCATLIHGFVFTPGSVLVIPGQDVTVTVPSGGRQKFYFDVLSQKSAIVSVYRPTIENN